NRLEGHAQVGAGGRGFEPGEQAGEGGLAQGELDGDDLSRRWGVVAGARRRIRTLRRTSARVRRSLRTRISTGSRGRSLAVTRTRPATTIMPGPRLTASASVGRRRDTTARSRRGKTSSAWTDSPKMPDQRSSSPRYRATPR